MAVAKMQRLAMLIHQSDLENTLDAVQEFGNFQVVSPKKEDLEQYNFKNDKVVAHDIDLKLAELEFAIRLLSPFAPAKKGLSNKVLGEKVLALENDVLKTSEDFDFQSIVSACNDIEENLNKQKNLLQRINEEYVFLENWKNLNFSLKITRSSQYAQMRIGEVSTRDYEDFAIRFSKIPLSHLQVVNSNNAHTYILLVFHQSVNNEMQQLLDLYKFNEASISVSNLAPKERITELKNLEAGAKKEIVELTKNLRVLATKNLQQLKLVYDFFLWQKSKQNAKEDLYKSNKVALLEGWVPVAKIELLKKLLNKVTSHAEVVSLNKEKVDTHPIFLDNKSWLAPFEIVTKIFGLPQSNEIDPTPILAPFFVLFFGFCLSDAGYGLFLVISMFLVLKLPLDSGMKKMAKLLIYCGFSTIFMGILFGGWLGLMPDQVPEFLVKELSGGKKVFIGQMFDPMTDLTAKIMPLTYGIGIMHLLIGVFLSGYNKIKNGKISEATQTSFFLAVFVIYAIFYYITTKISFFDNWQIILKNTLYVFLIVLVWALGYGKKNPFLRILSGLLSVVNQSIGWLSNVLSYSRLFSLGLATGIIANIFNNIALTFADLIMGDSGDPSIILIVIAVFTSIFILLFGHTINFCLNLLGSFIHSARLQFVEFFGQFAEFGGQEFTPFMRKGKYLLNKE